MCVLDYVCYCTLIIYILNSNLRLFIYIEFYKNMLYVQNFKQGHNYAYKYIKFN